MPKRTKRNGNKGKEDIFSKNLKPPPELGVTETSELGKRRSSSRIMLSTAKKVPRAWTQNSKHEYGTGAMKKEASITVAEAEVQLVPGVPTTDEEGASITQKRRERLRLQNERESGRAKEAKAQYDEAGCPISESKDKIRKISGGELMSQGLCFKTKNHLLSRVMSMEEHQKKRHVVNESRPLSLIA